MPALRSWISVLAWLALGFAPALAQPAASLNAAEYEVKAAYVYKFTSFVEWPADTFATADSPLVIGVIGADDIAAAIKPLVAGQTVDRHPVQVRRLDGKSALAAVQILLIGSVDKATLERTLNEVRGKPVLVISSNRLANAPEVMINFVTLDRRVRFEVAMAPVLQSRMRLSALMLSAAQNVWRDDQ